MCGIVGAISNKKNSITQLVLDGIRDLQYRGYDSCGCIFISDDKFVCYKSIGKVKNLVVDVDNLHSNVGMGHTRWATHGGVNLTNAHPHYSDGVAIVHNGIIENADALKESLDKQAFTTQTDTEVILKLINLYLSGGMQIIDVLHRVVDDLEGSFAVVIMLESEPDKLYMIKRTANLVFAKSDDLSLIASDVNVISSFSNEFLCFEDNDIAIISSGEIVIYNSGIKVQREARTIERCNIDVKYNYESAFMLQEILQQPDVVTNILQNFDFERVRKNIELDKFPCVNIVGCGSSYFAGCVAKQWIEKYLEVRVDVIIASEFKYKKFNKNELFVFVSQSGETADTISALKNVSSEDYVVCLVNVPGSTIARSSDFAISTNAGREISVAATKTFTSQILTFLCVILTQLKNPNHFFDEISDIRNKISAAINYCENSMSEIVDDLYNANNALFIGRGLGYILAKEGALKLKEVAYIHAESLPSGELKHGTIALIDKDLPVIVIAPHNELFSKVFSNIQEIHARGGKLIILTDEPGKRKLRGISAKILTLPETSDLTMPAVYVPALQLLAYYVALKRGNDIDHPRNLAKSVTVE